MKHNELKLLNVNLQLFGDEDGADDKSFDNDLSISESDGYSGILEDDDDPDYVEEEKTKTSVDDKDDPDDEEEPAEDVVNIKREPKGKPNKLFEKMRIEAEAQAKKKFDADRVALEAEKQEVLRIRQENEAREAERKILDNALSQENVWKRADEEGVSEEIAKKLIVADARAAIEAEKQRVVQRHNILQEQKNELRNDEYFLLLEKEVDAIVTNNPDLPFKDVYFHMVGMRRKELDKQLASQVEKRTIANMQDRNRRKSVTGSDGGSDAHVNPTSVLDRDSLEMSMFFGNDPRKIASYVNKNLKKKG